MNLSLNNISLIIICVISFSSFLFLVVFFILDFLQSEKLIDKYADEKNIKNLVKKFHSKLDIVNTQETSEILECLKEMEELDNIFYVIVDYDNNFMSEEEYIRVKSDILSNIISDKIKHISKGKNKKEKYKSLLDEIDVLKKRYPLYKKVYVEYIRIIKNKCNF